MSVPRRLYEVANMEGLSRAGRGAVQHELRNGDECCRRAQRGFASAPWANNTSYNWAKPARFATAGLAQWCGPQRLLCRSQIIVIQDRAEPARVGEQRVAAVAEQIEVERLVGLLLAVALDLDGLGRLAGGEGQRAGLGDVVTFAGLHFV